MSDIPDKIIDLIARKTDSSEKRLLIALVLEKWMQARILEAMTNTVTGR